MFQHKNVFPNIAKTKKTLLNFDSSSLCFQLFVHLCIFFSSVEQFYTILIVNSNFPKKSRVRSSKVN